MEPIKKVAKDPSVKPNFLKKAKLSSLIPSMKGTKKTQPKLQVETASAPKEQAEHSGATAGFAF